MKRLLLLLVLALLLGLGVAAVYIWGMYGVIGIVVLLAAVLLLSSAIDDGFFVRRALKAAPTTNIAEVEDGQRVKLIGTLKLLGEPIIAPLSGRQCAAYHAVVEHEPGGHSQSSTSMIVAAEERRACAFLICDDTGEAHVEPGGAESSIVHDFEHDILRGEVIYQQTPGPPELASRTDTLLMAYDTCLDALEAKHRSTSFRVREGVLVEGETVAVLGTAGRSSGDDGYRTHSAQVTISAQGNDFYISDDPTTLGSDS